MSNKPSHFSDVMFKIIRAGIIVGILATITGYYIDVSQRDTIVIQGIPERSDAADTSDALLSVQSGSPEIQPEYTTAAESTVQTAQATQSTLPITINESAPANVTSDIPAATTAAGTQETAVINVSELKSELTEPRAEADSAAQNSGLININTAPAYKLEELDGIGEVKAAAIVQYREENGNFKSVDELVNVKGIGEKTLEKNRDRITV